MHILVNEGLAIWSEETVTQCHPRCFP